MIVWQGKRRGEVKGVHDIPVMAVWARILSGGLPMRQVWD
jgi:hypothetical protein